MRTRFWQLATSLSLTFILGACGSGSNSGNSHINTNDNPMPHPTALPIIIPTIEPTTIPTPGSVIAIKVSNNHAGQLATSTNLENWQSLDLSPFKKDTSEDFVQVQRVNGKWFVLGNKGTILTSTDAANWRKNSIDGISLGGTYFTGVVYTNGTYLAYFSNDNGVNSKNILTTSTSGEAWEPAVFSSVDSADVNLHIFANQGKLVKQVGFDRMATSNDYGKTWQPASLSFYGTNWTKDHRFYFSTCYKGSCVASGGGSGGALIVTQDPALNFSVSTKGFFTLSPASFAWGYATTVLPNDKFCALIGQVAAASTTTITSSISCSDNGSTWTTPIKVSDIQATVNLPQFIFHYVPAVNKYIITGAGGDYISSDGSKWTRLNQDNVKAMAAITLATP